MEQKIKIMIVEDEIIISQALRRVLQQNGCDACPPKATGEQALKDIEYEKPNLVIMDISLCGGLDGIETARKIRQRMEIPIIFLSGRIDNTVLEYVERLESSELVTKPSNRDEILEAIERILKK